MTIPRNLRYSPVNYLIVSWGDSAGTPFNNCGLPSPQPCTVSSSCGTTCDHPLPIAEAIDTYDWERWLPEVIVGIEDPDEEIAANYVRQAAIEFCKGGRVLQREVVVELQQGVMTYPLIPYVGEQIIGIIGIRQNEGRPQSCSSQCMAHIDGVTWRLDTARNELTLVQSFCWNNNWNCQPFCWNNNWNCQPLRLLVWSAPTEDACLQDRFLYDRFRADITKGARAAYARAVHFRDRPLMQSLSDPREFETAIVLAKRKAMNLSSGWMTNANTAFGGGSRNFRGTSQWLR